MKQFRTGYCSLRSDLRGRFGPGASRYDRTAGGSTGSAGADLCLVVVQAEVDMGTSGRPGRAKSVVCLDSLMYCMIIDCPIQIYSLLRSGWTVPEMTIESRLRQ